METCKIHFNQRKTRENVQCCDDDMMMMMEEKFLDILYATAAVGATVAGMSVVSAAGAGAVPSAGAPLGAMAGAPLVSVEVQSLLI